MNYKPLRRDSAMVSRCFNQRIFTYVGRTENNCAVTCAQNAKQLFAKTSAGASLETSTPQSTGVALALQNNYFVNTAQSFARSQACN